MVTGSSLSGDEFTTGVHAMPDKNSEPLTLELITTCMNEAARELGTMDPDDPRGAALVAELSQLMQLRRAVRFASDPGRPGMHGRACARNENAYDGRPATSIKMKEIESLSEVLKILND
jgi:hypothetical protein